MNKKRFRNERPIQIQSNRNLRGLNLSAFPVIGDLIIAPIFGQIPNWLQHQPHLVGAQLQSGNIGYLAGHKWWEQLFYINKLECSFTDQDVPKGTIHDPHFDFQVGWQIIIFEHENYVYILQADDDQSDKFSIWFRVGAQNYSNAWREVIKQINSSRD